MTPASVPAQVRPQGSLFDSDVDFNFEDQVLNLFSLQLMLYFKVCYSCAALIVSPFAFCVGKKANGTYYF